MTRQCLLRRITLLIVFVAFAAACGRDAQPRDVGAADACTFCRMTVSDARFAAQIAAPGEEPRVFDDIGCLAGWLKDNRPPDGAVAFVADHRTRQWVRAADAVYTRSPGVSTPMGSGIIAHADAGSRDADPDGRGEALTLTRVFGSATVPGGSGAR